MFCVSHSVVIQEMAVLQHMLCLLIFINPFKQASLEMGTLQFKSDSFYYVNGRKHVNTNVFTNTNHSGLKCFTCDTCVEMWIYHFWSVTWLIEMWNIWKSCIYFIIMWIHHMCSCLPYHIWNIHVILHVILMLYLRYHLRNIYWVNFSKSCAFL